MTPRHGAGGEGARQEATSPGKLPSPEQRRGQAARLRNEERRRRADKKDKELVGEYLPLDIDAILPPSLEASDDSFVPPKWLSEEVKRLAGKPVGAPNPPPFKFKAGKEAKQWNNGVLEASGYDLGVVIAEAKGSTIDYGSEFRGPSDLEPLLGKHPSFGFIEAVLRQGMPFQFKEEVPAQIIDKERGRVLAYGNHKSVQGHKEAVCKMVQKEVDRGFALLLPVDTVGKLNGSMVQLVGVTIQQSLDKKGNRVPKPRLTHDDSYTSGDRKISVNDLLDLSQYPEMIYGHCLSRTNYFVVVLRGLFPQEEIFVAKFDYSNAYRQITHTAEAAIKQIFVWMGTAYLMLRTTFGGSANPPTWCCLSEIVTDLVNEIFLDPEWDETVVFSPEAQVPPSPRRNGGGGPLGEAKEMAFSFPRSIVLRTDAFVDDLINVCLGRAEYLNRAALATLLAVHVTSCPHAGDGEPVSRRELLGQEKLAAEGVHAEAQIEWGGG